MKAPLLPGRGITATRTRSEIRELSASDRVSGKISCFEGGKRRIRRFSATELEEDARGEARVDRPDDGVRKVEMSGLNTGGESLDSDVDEKTGNMLFSGSFHWFCHFGGSRLRVVRVSFETASEFRRFIGYVSFVTLAFRPRAKCKSSQIPASRSVTARAAEIGLTFTRTLIKRFFPSRTRGIFRFRSVEFITVEIYDSP